MFLLQFLLTMSEQLDEVAGDDSSKIDIVPWRVPTVKVGCQRRLPDRELIRLAERVSTAPECLWCQSGWRVDWSPATWPVSLLDSIVACWQKSKRSYRQYTQWMSERLLWCCRQWCSCTPGCRPHTGRFIPWSSTTRPSSAVYKTYNSGPSTDPCGTSNSRW